MDKKEAEKYLEDVVLIKKTLKEQEGQPFIAPWVFFVWFIVITTATVISWVLWRNHQYSVQMQALRVWLPAFLVGGAFESGGWLQFFTRDDKVVFTDANKKMMISFSLFLVVLTVFAVRLIARNLLQPGDILAMVSLCLVLLSVFSYKELMAEGVVTAIFGIVLMAGNWSSPPLFVAAGLYLALIFGVAGMHTKLLGRKRERAHHG